MCKELSKELLPGENQRGWGGNGEDRQGGNTKRPDRLFQVRLSLAQPPGAGVSYT